MLALAAIEYVDDGTLVELAVFSPEHPYLIQFLGLPAAQMGVYRDRLIKRRLIVADGHGYVRFNMPHLRTYIEAEPQEQGDNTNRMWRF